MTTPVGPKGSVSALEAGTPDPTALISDIVKALETPGTSVETIATYIGEAVAATGFVVGAFNHQLGLTLASVPQATLLAAATVAAAGIAGFRLFFKTRKQQFAAALTASIHADHMAPLALKNGVIGSSIRPA